MSENKKQSPFSACLTHDFHKNGSYRILLLPSCNADYTNRHTLASAIDAKLDATQPDFVFLVGDVTRNLSDAEALHTVLADMLAPVFSRKLPWAHVFGDRDRAGVTADMVKAMPAVYSSLPLCLSGIGDAEHEDYTIGIVDAADGEPIVCLYCLDSHSDIHAYETRYGKPDADGKLPPARLPQPLYGKYYLDGIHYRQTIRCTHTAQALEEMYGRRIPSVLLFHTPIPEFSLVTMNQGNCRMHGFQRESIRCSVVNSGICAAALERGDVRAIYAGNTAKNNWYGIFGGIHIGQLIDFMGENGTPNGATVVEISRDGTVSEQYLP